MSCSKASQIAMIVGVGLVTHQVPSHGTEATVLTPFVGETTQEFEARKRGAIPENDRNSDPLTVPADASGHFFVEPMLDGRRIRMLVDTGASLVTLSHEDAQRMALRVASKDFTRQVSTANGFVMAAPITLARVQIENIVVHNVEALVLPPGRLKTSLLGMTFLKRLNAFEISEGRLVLR